VPHTVASNTNLGIAGRALGSLAPFVLVDVRGGDPVSAIGIGAVKTIISGVLLILAIPFLLELHVEKTFDVTQGYALVAAFWRHLCRVLERHLKRPHDAVSAVPVAAFKLVCLVRLEGVKTPYTLHTGSGQPEAHIGLFSHTVEQAACPWVSCCACLRTLGRCFLTLGWT
jgi:hypothetical protein